MKIIEIFFILFNSLSHNKLSEEKIMSERENKYALEDSDLDEVTGCNAGLAGAQMCPEEKKNLVHSADIIKMAFNVYMLILELLQMAKKNYIADYLITESVVQ